MGKLVISTNVSLDGVVEDPDGKEGTRFGGWFNQSLGTDFEPWAKVFTDEALGAEALLLGRRSEEWFATRWQSRDGEWADKLNSMPKYVVSGTLTEPVWSNSTVLKGDVVGEVSKLKERTDCEVLVYASYRLVHTLIKHGLIDEVRLFIFPILVGEGRRLFGETGIRTPLRQIHTSAVGSGLTFVSYEVARDA